MSKSGWLPTPASATPRCIAGAGACPPEDCGGPDAYHARREDATGVDAMDDLAAGRGCRRTGTDPQGLFLPR